MYQLVVFDLDGTLLNTLEDLADSTNHALSVYGYPKRTTEEVRCFVGNGIRKLMERSVPQGTTETEIDGVHAEFTSYYKEHCADKTKPYEGVLNLLRTLRENGVKTAVVSNKADYAVKELCEQYFNGLLDAAVGEREGIRRKPFPDSVNEVLRNLGTDRKHAVYIGDSDVDVVTAKNAGMDEIAVTWGFRDVAFLKENGATVFADRPEELADLILIPAGR